MRFEKIAERVPQKGELIEFEGVLCQVVSIDNRQNVLIVSLNHATKALSLKEYPIYHIGFS